MAKLIAAEKCKLLTTACSRMPERDGKDQVEYVCMYVCYSHKWREFVVSSGRLVFRCYDVFLWCYFYFVCFDSLPILMLFLLKPQPFLQSFFDNMQALG